jgi:hypothetical protein
MVVAGWIVELLFGALGLVPEERHAHVMEASVSWNYTTFLNIVFLVIAAILVARFLRTGGPAMLRMMNMAPMDEHDHGEDDHHDAGDAVYTCPMHPEVRSSTPGRCPKCGMDLVPEDG